jgi:hypothetical protein
MEPIKTKLIEEAKDAVATSILHCESVSIVNDLDLLNAEMVIRHSKRLMLAIVDKLDFDPQIREIVLPLEEAVSRLRNKMLTYRLKHMRLLSNFSLFVPNRLNLN